MFLLLFLFSASVRLSAYIVIEHKPIEYFIPHYRIKIDAKMKDYYQNFVQGKVKFKTPKNVDFFTVNMMCTVDNMRSATLPAPKKSTEKILYYIEAIDSAGNSFKTQTYTIPQIKLPAWQVRDFDYIRLESADRVTKNVTIDGFDEKVEFEYSAGDDRITFQNCSAKPKVLPKPKEQKIDKNQIKNASDDKVDFTGIWSIRRTLSTCKSGIFAYKLIKITSHNGKITSSRNIRKGTRFRYSEKNNTYLCELIDDPVENTLVGEKSVYTYQEFFDILKSYLNEGEFVRLLEFRKNKIVFELHLKDGTILTTVYKREKNIHRNSF